MLALPAVLTIGVCVDTGTAALHQRIGARNLALALYTQFASLAALPTSAAILFVVRCVGADSPAIEQTGLATQGTGSSGTQFTVGARLSAGSAVVTVVLQVHA